MITLNSGLLACIWTTMDERTQSLVFGIFRSTKKRVAHLHFCSFLKFWTILQQNSALIQTEMCLNDRTLLKVSLFFSSVFYLPPLASCWSPIWDPPLSLPRLVLSCLRLVHGRRQLKQVWGAGDTPCRPDQGEWTWGRTRLEEEQDWETTDESLTQRGFHFISCCLNRTAALQHWSCDHVIRAAGQQVPRARVVAQNSILELAVKQAKLQAKGRRRMQPLIHWSVLLLSVAACLLCACLNSSQVTQRNKHWILIMNYYSQAISSANDLVWLKKKKGPRWLISTETCHL